MEPRTLAYCTGHSQHAAHTDQRMVQYDVFKARGNATAVPVFIIGIPAAAMFFTGVSSVTANSRCADGAPAMSCQLR